MLANFTILADNPVTIDPMKIKDIVVWGTVQEGRVLPVNRAGVGRRAGIGSNITGANPAPREATPRADSDLSRLAAAGLVEMLGRHQHHD